MSETVSMTATFVEENVNVEVSGTEPEVVTIEIVNVVAETGEEGAGEGEEPVAPASTPGKALLWLSGRVNFETDGRWVTNADDTYGPIFDTVSEAAGTGTDPEPEWEHLGHIIPAGVTIKRVHMSGRMNTKEVDDALVSLQLLTPATSGADSSGIDADGEATNVEVARETWMDGLTGDTNDKHSKTFEVDHEVTETSQLGFYFQPVGTLTSARIFHMTACVEIEF